MTHTEFLTIHAALSDRAFHMPFRATSPTAVERDCLHRIRYALRDHYLYREGGIYAAELYEEAVNA
jgi:hypothetical protein